MVHMPVLILAAFLLLWYLISHFWADSIRHQHQLLSQTAARQRYGWRCPRCGHIYAPVCGYRGCTGALLWTENSKRIICGRCGRHHVASPWLFRETPVTWPRRCKNCGWLGIVRVWDTS